MVFVLLVMSTCAIRVQRFWIEKAECRWWQSGCRITIESLPSTLPASALKFSSNKKSFSSSATEMEIHWIGCWRSCFRYSFELCQNYPDRTARVGICIECLMYMSPLYAHIYIVSFLITCILFIVLISNISSHSACEYQTPRTQGLRVAMSYRWHRDGIVAWNHLWVAFVSR